MRDINRIFGRLLFKTEDEVRFIANHSQDRFERVLTRFLLLMVNHLTLDYEGQRREKNGQFGKGKKNGENVSGGKAAASITPNIDTLSKKDAKRAHEMSNAISSGRAKLRKSGMEAHVSGTKEYRRHTAEMAVKGLTASYFREDYACLASEIQAALKKRKAHYVVLHNGNIHAKIDLRRPIGVTYGKDGRSEHETSIITVVYSSKNNDWHFYPDD